MPRLNTRLDKIEAAEGPRPRVWKDVHVRPDGTQTPPPAEVDRWAADARAAGLEPVLWNVVHTETTISIGPGSPDP